MLSITQRIPTAQYAYIEFTQSYPSVEDAIDDHKRLVKLYEEQSQGLSTNEWAHFRNTMIATGEVNPNVWEKLSAAQKWWVNETKKALRSHEVQEPVIN